MSDTAEKQTDIVVDTRRHQNAHLSSASHGNAIREGGGNGNAIRTGKGRGDAIRVGKGDGDVARYGEGYGNAMRHGKGRGDAIREGTGAGNAFRRGKGRGDAIRDGEGRGDAIRRGTGNGVALILGRVGYGCFEEDSRGRRFPETIYYDDDRRYWLNVREIEGAPFFTAGCRRFSLKEALDHWGDGYMGTGDNEAYIQAIENWVDKKEQ